MQRERVGALYSLNGNALFFPFSHQDYSHAGWVEGLNV